MIDLQTYGAYIAFFMACATVMYEKMNDLHNSNVTIAGAFLIALCSMVFYKENPGLMILAWAFFLVTFKMRLLYSTKSLSIQ